jgi:hypothetical protein
MSYPDATEGKAHCLAHSAKAMWILRPLSGFVIVTCVVGCVLSATQQRAPGQPVSTTFDAPPPPPDLATLVQRTPLIIEGVVLSESHRTLASGSEVADFRVRVVEVVKGDGRELPLGEITVSISRIAEKRADGTVRFERAPWSIGTRSIFFLKYWEGAAAYSPFGGISLEVKNQSVAIPANLSHMPSFAGRDSFSRQSLIDLLKRGGR